MISNKQRLVLLVIIQKFEKIKTISGDISLVEVIPIGAVVALGKAAVVYRQHNVEVFMEIKANDSLTDEFIGGSAKQGKGAEISGSNEAVEFDHIKPLLNIWVKDTKETFEKLSVLQADK